MHESIPVILLRTWGLGEYSLGIMLTSSWPIAHDHMFSFLVRNAKILGVNMFEQECLLLFLLTLVPVGVTGLKCFRLHFGNFKKFDTRWEIEQIKELVWVTCNESPRNTCPVVVGCMACVCGCDC
jgi:hypothetical protein